MNGMNASEAKVPERGESTYISTPNGEVLRVTRPAKIIAKSPTTNEELFLAELFTRESSEGRTVAESLIHDLAGYKPYGRRASTCGKCRKRETFSIGSLPHGWSEAHGNVYCPECAGDEQFHREDRERRMQTFTPEERKRFFGEGRMESLLNGTPARAVIENDATPPRTPRRFPDLPPEPEGRCVYPGSSEYKRLFRAYGYTDPAFYPKEFRQRPNGSWEPVL